MASRAKSICRKSGCNKLIDKPGYCSDHVNTDSPFKVLDRKKTSAAKKFYSSAAWTRTSLRHRSEQPLCQEHLRNGRTAKGQMVHHTPDLEELLSKGLNPLDSKYLETLCNTCHLVHLRAKRS